MPPCTNFDVAWTTNMFLFQVWWFSSGAADCKSKRELNVLELVQVGMVTWEEVVNRKKVSLDQTQRLKGIKKMLYFTKFSLCSTAASTVKLWSSFKMLIRSETGPRIPLYHTLDILYIQYVTSTSSLTRGLCTFYYDMATTNHFLFYSFKTPDWLIPFLVCFIFVAAHLMPLWVFTITSHVSCDVHE